MKKSAFAVALFATLVLCLSVPLPVSAQILTGEVTGTITDPSGAAVPGATITALCPDTKLTRTVRSGGVGEYRLADMPPCTYKVSVTAQGFKTSVRDVTVSVALVTKADFQLQVGQRTETITVESAAPLVDFSPGVNSDVETQRIVELPFNGRDFKSVLAITPGVARSPGGGFLDVSINGMRTTANNYLIDGMYNNDRFYGSEIVGQPGVLGLSASLLPPDAISEFTVQQLPSAEYGVKGGASVNVTLKSGTNDFHGGAFYFGHWDHTDADNWVAKDANHVGEIVAKLSNTTFTPGPNIARLHNHQYGASIGGPFVKDRTFFFGEFEGQRNISLVPYPVGVPNQGDLNAAMALFSNPAVNVNGLPINPAGVNVLKFMPFNPSLTTGGSTVNVALPNTGVLSQFLIKIDHKLSSNMNISGRYFFADSLQSAPSSGFTIPPPSSSGLGVSGFNTIAPTRVQMVGLSWVYNIASNKILDTRFGWQRYAQILDVNNKINPLSLGIDTGPLDPLDFGVPVVYTSSITAGYIGGVFGYPLSTRPTQVYDASSHFTWIKGTHTMKMGGNYQFASTFSLRNRARSRMFSFETDWTTALAEYLLGRVDQMDRSFGDTSRHLVQPSMGVYWQDEWKIRPRVTLSFGLRWEINGALGEAEKKGSNFFPCAAPEPTVCPPKGAPAGLVRLGTTFNRLHNLDVMDFGPRAGVAWDVFGNGKTALRAGYAMTYDVANFAAISAPYTFNGARAGAFTNSILGNFSVSAIANDVITNVTPDDVLFEALGQNTCYNPAVNAPGATPDFVCWGPQPGPAGFGGNTTVPYTTFGPNPTGTPPFNIYGTVPDLKTPRIHYYSLTLQHELFKNSVLTVAYVGSYGQNLFAERSLNNRPIGCWDAANGGQQKGPPAGPGSANDLTIDCSRPFDSVVLNAGVGAPATGVFKYVLQLNNAGYSRYNSLQASFRQRDWHGISSQYSYTWANCIDLTSVSRGGGGNVSPFENPVYNPEANRGFCDTDRRHNFVMGGLYQIPKWSPIGRFGEGWEIGSVYTGITGSPFTIFVSRSRDHSGQDNVVNRADCLQPPHYDYSNPTLFITNSATAFGRPGPNLIGSCGRNSLRGPGLQELDLNLNKTTKITERFSIQFRWEVFNVLNHPIFGPGTANSTFPGSGSCVQPAGFPASCGTSLFSAFSGTPDSLNPGVAQGGPRAMQFGLKLIF
jgi:hypothetical protein